MESIGTLAGGIAQDFNNILNIILGYSSVLEKSIASRGKFSESVNAIDKAVTRGAGLVRQLLTFARKNDVQLESVNINDVVSEWEKMLAETFPKTITIEMQLDSALPSIYADFIPLHQTL
jgi:signal transduction histidine kinase